MMDSIQTIIHDYDEVEFYVSLDYHSNESELYDCQGWGNLYTELGVFDNQPTILNGDTDLDQDGLPDHHLWNSFAGETYSAYAFIDHHMVIRYLSYMPNYSLFTETLIPDLIASMYGCIDSLADNYDPSAVYEDDSCYSLEITTTSNFEAINDYEFLSVYPNPFNSSIKIQYKLKKTESFLISVFDINGKLISVLEKGNKVAGKYSIDWLANYQPSGVYVINISTDKKSESKNIFLLK